MRLLLDTHVWLWSEQQPEKLGAKSRKILLDATNELFISSISTLEIAQLLHKERITLKGDLASWIDQSAERLSLQTITLSNDIAVQAYTLPGAFHSDPADRIIVATARQKQFKLMTADERILAYGQVNVVNAVT